MQIQLVDNGSGKVVMQFCNCSLTLPSSTGFYVVSSGCGSGKTTIIKGIIKKYNDYPQSYHQWLSAYPDG